MLRAVLLEPTNWTEFRRLAAMVVREVTTDQCAIEIVCEEGYEGPEVCPLFNKWEEWQEESDEEEWDDYGRRTCLYDAVILYLEQFGLDDSKSVFDHVAKLLLNWS